MRTKTIDITAKQKEFLDNLIEFIRDNSYTPTIREMGEFVGLSSSATVHYYLKELEDKRYIKRINNRNIQILRSE